MSLRLLKKVEIEEVKHKGVFDFFGPPPIAFVNVSLSRRNHSPHSLDRCGTEMITVHMDG